MVKLSDLKELADHVDNILLMPVPRGYIARLLYSEVRTLTREPLTLQSSKMILNKAQPRDVVAIITGFRVPPRYIQETDGPLGTAVLSRCFIRVGYRPVILTEKSEISIGSIVNALRSLGVRSRVLNSQSLIRGIAPCCTRHEVTIVPIEPGHDLRAYLTAVNVVAELNPSIAVFIEKPSPNSAGIYHSMRGIDITQHHIDVHALMDSFVRNYTVTLGIGDGGNEVGMGIVEAAVRKYVPYGNMCNCPCKQGIAAALRTDSLIVSSISNWGAYGLSAVLSAATSVADCIVNPEEDRAMLSGVVEAGAVDGVYGVPRESVDGLHLNDLMTFTRVLHKVYMNYARLLRK